MAESIVAPYGSAISTLMSNSSCKGNACVTNFCTHDTWNKELPITIPQGSVYAWITYMCGTYNNQYTYSTGDDPKFQFTFIPIIPNQDFIAQNLPMGDASTLWIFRFNNDLTKIKITNRNSNYNKNLTNSVIIFTCFG